MGGMIDAHTQLTAATRTHMLLSSGLFLTLLLLTLSPHMAHLFEASMFVYVLCGERCMRASRL